MRIRSKSESGQAMLEFALVTISMTFMFAGAFTIGAMLNKALQVSNVTRSAAVLMVRSVTDTKADLNLALTQNQRMLIREAGGLGMAANAQYDPSATGNGAIFLSQVVLIGANECAKGTTGQSPPWSSGNCPNYNNYVFAYYVPIGNTTRWASAFGHPSLADVELDGTITMQNMVMHSANAILPVSTVTSAITLSQSQYALISETYADISSVAVFGYWKPPVIYYRTIT
jgi:hypothetical protein